MPEVDLNVRVEGAQVVASTMLAAVEAVAAFELYDLGEYKVEKPRAKIEKLRSELLKAGVKLPPEGEPVDPYA